MISFFNVNLCSAAGWPGLVGSRPPTLDGAGRSAGRPQLRPGNSLPDEPHGHGSARTNRMGRVPFKVSYIAVVLTVALTDPLWGLEEIELNFFL